MRKTKLRLDRETIRVLETLARVSGGEPRGSVDADACAPNSAPPYACSDGCRTVGTCPLETFVGPCG